jgi:hypothetical protein
VNKQISYQRRLKYLGIASIFLLIASYQLSIRKTFKEYNKFHQYKSQGHDQVHNKSTFDLLESKNRMLDTLLYKYILDTLDESKNLLGVVTNFCNDHDLKFQEYKPFNKTKNDTIQTITRGIKVQGGFTNCLRLIYHLETQTETGRISGVAFKSMKNAGTSEVSLNCTLFIQNLIPMVHEID